MNSTTAGEASRPGRLKDVWFGVGFVAFLYGLMATLMGLFGLAFHLPRPDLTGYWEILAIGLVAFIPGLISTAIWAWDHGREPRSTE